MRIFNSLASKLIISFVLLVSIISAASFVLTVRAANDTILQNLREQMQSLASVSASQIDGTVVANLKPGDENTPEFIGIRDKLLLMRKDNKSVIYSYIMKLTSTNKLAFVVDDTYGIQQDAAKIGDAYQSNNPSTAEQDFKEITAGLNGPASASALYTDNWGTFLSGYAPVRDASGKAVAILGVDMTADQTLAKEGFLTDSIYIIFGIGILISALFVTYFAFSIRRDIRGITNVISGLRSQREKDDIMKAMKRKDEVGDLAKSAAELMEFTVRQSLDGDFLNKF